VIGDPHVPTIAVPKMYANEEDRCDLRCLATQHGRMTGNDLVAVLLHMAADPHCAHCANIDHSVEAVYSYIAQLVTIARTSGPRA